VRATLRKIGGAFSVGVLALASAGTPPALAQQKAVTLFVPVFDGPGSLGRNAATILNLQVWQTLRKAPFPNPSHVTFGDGLVVWDVNPLTPAGHDEAERAAQRNGADLALWGRALRYGDGVVVQSYLTLVPAVATERPPLWAVTLAGRSGPVTMSVKVPRLRYEFRPIALTTAVVSTYTSPDALKIYASPTSTQPIGEVGSAFKGLEVGGAAARIDTQGRQGWIRLPQLSSNRSEVVDFTGGLIRILRGDWAGAAQLLQNVIANPQTPATLRLDAYLYHGVALERSGRSGTRDFERAVELNAYDQAAVKYLMMSRVVALRSVAGSAERSGLVAEGQRLIAANQYLFPANDPWLKKCAEIFGR
jgi:hypothetical protein